MGAKRSTSNPMFTVFSLSTTWLVWFCGFCFFVAASLSEGSRIWPLWLNSCFMSWRSPCLWPCPKVRVDVYTSLTPKMLIDGRKLAISVDRIFLTKISIELYSSIIRVLEHLLNTDYIFVISCAVNSCSRRGSDASSDLFKVLKSSLEEPSSVWHCKMVFHLIYTL